MDYVDLMPEDLTVNKNAEPSDKSDSSFSQSNSPYQVSTSDTNALNSFSILPQYSQSYGNDQLVIKSRSNSSVHDSGVSDASVPSYKNNNSSMSSSYYNQKKVSKPMIEKRRRDRINRCLNLLKEIVIDGKRYPVPNVSTSGHWEIIF